MDSAIGLSTCSPSARRPSATCWPACTPWTHFRDTPLDHNLPVLMGLLAVWNNNFLDAATVAVLPYEQYLKRFPAYLQQLAMESNGKHVTGRRPRRLRHRADLLGRARHQRPALLPPAHHQGTRIVPCDFIGFGPLNPARPARPADRQLIAQGEALAFGRSADEVRADGTPKPGGPPRLRATGRATPSRRRLTPWSLGTLIALYEHSVFVQGVIWNIDSFDQWGVELGKQLAGTTFAELTATRSPNSPTTVPPTP
jgi:glucose-6-phosphate isomerase